MKETPCHQRKITAFLPFLPSTPAPAPLPLRLFPSSCRDHCLPSTLAMAVGSTLCAASTLTNHLYYALAIRRAPSSLGSSLARVRPTHTNHIRNGKKQLPSTPIPNPSCPRPWVATGADCKASQRSAAAALLTAAGNWCSGARRSCRSSVLIRPIFCQPPRPFVLSFFAVCIWLRSTDRMATTPGEEGKISHLMLPY